MKKIIALVLTVLMVSSMLITGISATRVASKTTTTTEPVDTREKFIKCTAHGQFGISDTFGGVTDNYTFKAVLKSSTEEFGNADLGETVTYLAGSPNISMKAGTLGYNGSSETLNYTFADDTLYTIEYVVAGDTTVYVNGEEIGTLAGAPRAMFYGVMYRYLIKELTWSQNGEVFQGVKAEDYNDGDTVGFLADAEVVTLGELIPGEEITTYYNKNEYDVHQDAQYDGKAFYTCDDSHWPNGEDFEEVLYFYPDHDKGFFPGDYMGNVVLSVDVCALSEDATSTRWADDYGFITFDMANNKIGVGGANISLNTPWNVGEWHHVEVYSIYGDVGSVIMVDGQLLTDSGSVCAGKNGAVGRFVCCGFHNMAFDNLEYYAGAGANGVKGELLYSEDFDDGVFQKAGDSLGRVLDKKISDAVDEHYAHDLGMYYYTWADEEVAESAKYVKCAANGHFADESPVNGVTDDFTMRLVLKSSTAEFANADLGEMVGWLDGSPLVNMKAGTISFVGAPSTLNYTFADETEYTIDFVVDGNTTVYVNGEEVGTIAKNMRAIVYGVFYRYLVKEVSFIQDGNAFVSVKADDYNDGDACGWLADAEVIVQNSARPSAAVLDLGGANAKWEFDFMLDETTKGMVSYTNADPVFAVDDRATETIVTNEKFINATGGSPHMMDNSIADDEYTFRLVIKTPSNYYDETKLGEFVRWVYDGPEFNMENGTIGYGGKTPVNYTFAYDTLYTIDWVVDGDTTIFVNGEEIGTIPGAMKAQMYGAFYRTMVKEMSFIKNDAVIDGVKADDFNDGDLCSYLGDAEVVTLSTSEEVSSGSAGYIGVGDTTIPYEFAAGEWYHAIFDGTAGNGTDIYVNGVLVGHVANTIKAAWNAHPCKLSIDNLSINDYFEDFEDDAELKLGDGAVVPYDFGDAPEPPEPEPEYDIFHWIETEEPGGSAYIVKDGYNYEVGQNATNVSTYFDMETLGSGKRDFVYNFDLALVPEVDTTGSTYFEIWSDYAADRWVVGVDSTGYRSGGNAEDLTAFNWGEATKDNFHNVTYSFKNHVATIYVDGVQVYERTTKDEWRNMMIGNVYNGTAIIDNVQLFTYTNSNAKQPNELEAKEIDLGREEDLKAINLDAADFCAANGHIQYQTSRTTYPTCTETGVDTTICAICGQTAKTTTVPALGHNWPNYYNGIQKDDGVWTWKCKRCDETVSTTVPEVAEGTLEFFADFDSAILVQTVAGIFNGERETVADGVGHFENGSGQNYNEFTIPSNCRNNYTISFDAFVKGTFDTSDTEGYGHVVYFWFGGDSGIANEAGYDFDNGYFFVRPYNATTYTPITAEYELSMNEWHNIQFKVYAYGEDADENWMKILVDGEEVLVFDEWFDTAFCLPTSQSFCILRDFGVEADIDNYAIGTADLKFAEHVEPAVIGDVNGDGKVNSKDLSLLKAILAGDYEPTAEEYAAADINGDGKVNSRDVSLLKAYLAGEAELN